jgi:LPS export ABC transporter protein LptC
VDIRYLFLIIFAFVFELFFLSKDLRFKESPISVKNVDIEFLNSKTYDISKEKINNLLICKKIQQITDKKIFFSPVATLFDTNITKTIVAKDATLFDKTNILKLQKNVKIIYQDKHLQTDMIKYNLTNFTVIDSDKFIIKSNNFIAKGNHLYFDTKKSIIKAKNIKYNFYERE